MNWLDFEVKRTKVKVTTRPKILHGQKSRVHQCIFSAEAYTDWRFARSPSNTIC